MVLEPLRWNERSGWRRMHETEREAQFRFWREIGKLMAIRQIPQTLAELERFNVEYKASRYTIEQLNPRPAPSPGSPSEESALPAAASRATRQE